MGPTVTYCILIACSGQASTQTPQSMQASGLTFALPSSIEIASLGHSSTQVSQPVHFSLSTCAGITLPFPKTPQSMIKKAYTSTMVEMLQNWPRNTKQIFEILAVLWMADNLQLVFGR